MCALERKDICELVDADNDRAERRASAGASGIAIVAEEGDDEGTLALKPDTGDFVKWMRAAHPDLPLEVPSAPRRVLRSSDVWIPLVILAKDVGLPVYLNLVSSYLYDRFKAALRGSQPRVHLAVEFVDESTGIAKRFTFEGDHASLQSAIKKVDINAFMDE